MKHIFLLALCLALSLEASSQWSVGARVGGTSGLSLKKYSRSNKSAFETIAGWSFDERSEGFFVSPVFERLGSLTDKGNLAAIFGPGIPMIFGDEFHLGAGLMLGLDWRITRRFGLQADWYPSYIFINESYFSGYNAAISARWLFGRGK